MKEIYDNINEDHQMMKIKEKELESLNLSGPSNNFEEIVDFMNEEKESTTLECVPSDAFIKGFENRIVIYVETKLKGYKQHSLGV